MAIPAVTREYTRRSCCNSRNHMTHTPRREMRLYSPALCAEQSHIPNQTHKALWFSWWNTRESPRTLSQDEKNTDVTSRMHNSLVYPKSTRDEAHFPFFGSIPIPCSTAYSTSGLTSLGNYRDSLRHPSQVYMNINFSTATREKHHVLQSISRWELISCVWLKRWANFPQATQVEFSLSNRYMRGMLCFLSQVEWTAGGPDSKEGQIFLQWVKFRLVIHLTRWRDVWIPCGDAWEILRCPPHLDRGNHIPLTPQEAHEIHCFKRWRYLTLFENG